MNSHKTGGGVATNAGINYQARVAAWFAVGILAEQEFALPEYIPANVTIASLRCETEQPVDDLLVVTDQGGCLFSQAKHTLSLATKVDSELASALGQCVRQFIACRNASGTGPWERPLETHRDRLLITTSASSSASIRQDLPALLHAIRALQQAQTVSDAASTADHRNVLSVIRNHIKTAWQGACGQTPSESELKTFLSLMRIQVLDVDAGQDNEREAQTLLRTSILNDSSQAEAAWDILFSACIEFATTRTGASRSQLQTLLIAHNIALKAPRSYQSDIERLCYYSRHTLDALAELSCIRLGDEEIHIPRVSTDALAQALLKTDLLLIGEPGSGKSGALYSVARRFQEEGKDVVVFAADRVQSRSLAALRTEIGLTHDLEAVLDNWPSVQSGFLIVDALDKELAGTGQQPLRELISRLRRAKGRWTVLASVRKFDLRHSKELQKTFSGTPPTSYAVGEFQHIAHFEIPTLSSNELTEFGQKSAAIGALLERAGSRLQELLVIPIHIRLIADLLGAGFPLESLTPIRTQAELLDRYWEVRVVALDQDNLGDARETLLRQACERILVTLTTSIRRADLAANPAASPALVSLLRNRVLMEWQPSSNDSPDRYRLLFAHNVLSDFAISRLILSEPPGVNVRLGERPDLALVVRPSLAMHFERLWLDNATGEHISFWREALTLVADVSVPEIARLVGPAVAAHAIEDVREITPLLDALQSTNQDDQTNAEETLTHLFMAALAFSISPTKGEPATVWCQIIERCMQSPTPRLPALLNPMLAQLCQNLASLTPDAQQATGLAARRMLQQVTGRTPRHDALITSAIRNVCRSFATDPVASESLLRPIIEPAHLAEVGYQELPWIAYEINTLIPSAPAFAADIFIATFTLIERRQDSMPMGTGNILSLSTTPQQAIRNACFTLKEAFPAFLETAPHEATRALIAIIQEYVPREHPIPSGVRPVFSVIGGEGTPSIAVDYSVIWDVNRAYADDEQAMTDSFQTYLEKLAAAPEYEYLRKEVVDHVLNSNRYAMLWRRLLESAIRFPQTLGQDLWALMYSIPILTIYDTSALAGSFLATMYPYLKPEERERVEETLLSLPDRLNPEDRPLGESVRDRLLAQLPIEQLVSKAARLLYNHNGMSSNVVDVSTKDQQLLPVAEEALIEAPNLGATPENKQFLDTLSPVKNFTDRHLNAIPTAEAIAEVFPSLETIAATLENAGYERLPASLQSLGWGFLAEACEQISRVDLVVASLETVTLIRSVLLHAARRPEPFPDEKQDRMFDTQLIWERPLARIAAARGLVQLGRHQAVGSPELIAQINVLYRDPVPAVRYQVATALWGLVNTWPDDVWRVTAEIANTDPSSSVVEGLTRSLHHLSRVDTNQTVVVLDTILNRFADHDGAQQLLRDAVEVLVEIEVLRGHPGAHNILYCLIDAPSKHSELLANLLTQLRPFLTLGSRDGRDDLQDAARQRAFALLAQTARIARIAWDALRQSLSEHNLPSSNQQEEAQCLVRVLATVGEELYFGSGAVQSRGTEEKAFERIVNQAKRRFFDAITPILDDVVSVPIPRTVHYVLEMLEYLIETDPKKVFLQIDRFVQAGINTGYQYEVLGAQLIVRIVERFLADHASLLASDDDCRRALVRILDSFVRPGWPEMLRLAYRVEEIFR